MQDGIKAAKRSLQMEIQTAVHKIYQQLSVTLEKALQANKHHIGKTHYFCLSTSGTLKLLVSCKFSGHLNDSIWKKQCSHFQF